MSHALKLYIKSASIYYLVLFLVVTSNVIGLLQQLLRSSGKYDTNLLNLSSPYLEFSNKIIVNQSICRS